MARLRHLDLFSGIGGFAYGFARSGRIETIAFCETEPFCKKVLRRQFPAVKIYGDIKQLSAEQLAADGCGQIDLITAGFPCQDISQAANNCRRAGIIGTRSGLFYEAMRLVDEIRPKYLLLENVSALVGGGGGEWFRAVLARIAESGRDAEWACIPATAVGAPHQRDRIFILSTFGDETAGRVPIPNAAGRRPQHARRPVSRQRSVENHSGDSAFCLALAELPVVARQAPWSKWRLRQGKDNSKRRIPDKPELCLRVDGLPDWLARHSRQEQTLMFRAIGNAIVPQIAEAFGRVIQRG